MTFPEKLKAQTHDLHEQLESNTLLKGLMSPELSMADYARVLRLFYGYFTPLEQQLISHQQLKQYLPDLDQRRKASALLHDYTGLPGHSDTGKLPLCPTAPVISSTAEAFGCLYVLEGSTLGGRFIAQHVSSALGAEAENSLTFFRGYGTETGRYWKTFREALLAFSNQTSADEVIVRSAKATFQQFNNWLSANENNTRN